MPTDESAIALDLTPLDTALEPLKSQGRTALLPALYAAQDMFGYVPEAAAGKIGRQLGVPLADVYGVLEFYALIYGKPVGKQVVLVCDGPACLIEGAERVLDNVCRRLGVEAGEVSADGEWTVQRTPCLGLCEHAPAAQVGAVALSSVDPERTREMLDLRWVCANSIVGGDIRILTKNCGNARTTRLEEYVSGGGYEALRKAVTEMTPADVIAEVKASGLVGRGGAAFPTGVKWEGAAEFPATPKYMVCNDDESEPGTFKDRILIEDDPHRTLEGMVIAAYAVGAHKGYLYIRGEYPYGRRNVLQAIEDATEAGFLGRDILGRGFDFEIEVRRGGGAYICGEETALFESIEGKRGFPRIKPPFPTTHGLFGKPTVINNVETLCNIPLIIGRGAAGFRKFGTEQSPGPKLFCVSGDVLRPGLFEAPFGVTLRHLLQDLAGGVKGGKLQAVLFGGAAGAFATEEQLDVKLAFEDLRAEGLPLGSGVIMVFNETRDLRQVLRGLGRFFAEESCGKCYPCQLGTQRQYEILSRLADGQPLNDDVARLQEVGWTMTDASLCGLGQTAASAVLSAMKRWPDMFGKRSDHGLQIT